MRTQFWQDWAVVLVGVCTGASAFAYSALAPFWNLFLTGLAIVVLAALAIIGRRWAQAGTGVLGIWLIVAPIVLGLASLGATFEHLIVGILLVVLASWRLIRGLQTTGFQPEPPADEHKAMSPD